MQLIPEKETAIDTKIIMSMLGETLKGKILPNGLISDLNGYKERIQNEVINADKDTIDTEKEKVDVEELLLKLPTHNDDDAALENPDKKKNLTSQEAIHNTVMEYCEENVNVSIEHGNENSTITFLHDKITENTKVTDFYSAKTSVENEIFDSTTKQDTGDELMEEENYASEEKDELTLLKQELAYLLAGEKSEADAQKEIENTDKNAMKQVCINEEFVFVKENACIEEKNKEEASSVKDKISSKNKASEATNLASSSQNVCLNNKKSIDENISSTKTHIHKNITDVLLEDAKITNIALQHSSSTNRESEECNSFFNNADCGRTNITNKILNVDVKNITEVIPIEETKISLSHNNMSSHNEEIINEDDSGKSEGHDIIKQNPGNVANMSTNIPSQENKENIEQVISSNKITSEVVAIFSIKTEITPVSVQSTNYEKRVGDDGNYTLTPNCEGIIEKVQKADNDVEMTPIASKISDKEPIKDHNSLNKTAEVDKGITTDDIPPSYNKERKDENKTSDSKDITEFFQKTNDDVEMTILDIKPLNNKESVDANSSFIKKTPDPKDVEMTTNEIPPLNNKECINDYTANCKDITNPSIPSNNKENVNNISSSNKTINCDDFTEIISNKIVKDTISIDSKEDILNEEDGKDVEEDKTINIERKIPVEEKPTEKPVVNPFPVICKLSNNLDILSDDEEEPPKETHDKTGAPAIDKQCINIDDDDDIMFIEDTNSDDSKSGTAQAKSSHDQVDCNQKTNSKKEDLESDEVKLSYTETTEVITDKDSRQLDIEDLDCVKQPQIIEKTLESKSETLKPLLSNNVLKSAKKNLADMTRDDLEEFCILRIVESIVDRSNLSDIKTKLKTMAQNIEEYKKKAMMLTKQNRDLQVVLKSVQEEQKKAPNTPITPLRINRSVGMQVLMTEKPGVRRKLPNGPQSAQNTNSTVTRQMRQPMTPSPRLQKQPGGGQNIPVPRLVPANSPVMKPPNTPQAVSNVGKTPSPVPSGTKNASAAQKGAEKRPHNKVQSVTVDLTDDEPPAKINAKNSPTPPVRLVPSQNLLAPQRQPFGLSVNSPRKVYIPISGPQGQNIRPGQTIMLKSVPATGPRQRCPPPQMPKIQQSQVRTSRIHGNRHPAPLPDAMKQYQPPTWKALPPAPDLKLSKVENGIVISWKIEGYQEDSYEEIASYQLYAYQETSSPPSTALWKKIGDVKALPLPMACTLTQFMAGFKYYFAVRAVDIRSRLGPFSLPGSILLLNKM